MRLTKADILQAPLIEFIGLIAITFVVFFGGTQVMNGNVTTGTFVAFIAAALSMYKPAKAVTEVNTDIQTMRASGERIFELLDEVKAAMEGLLEPDLRNWRICFLR